MCIHRLRNYNMDTKKNILLNLLKLLLTIPTINLIMLCTALLGIVLIILSKLI